MTRLATLSLALTAFGALTAGCVDASDPAPRLDDVDHDADVQLELVDRDAVLAAASDFDVVPPGPAPVLGGASEGFTMSFDGAAISEGASSVSGFAYDNYLAGVASVVWADTVTALVVGPPAVAIGVASAGEPVQIDTNLWQVSNTVVLWGNPVTTELTVAWVGVGWLAEMRLTSGDGTWDDTLWFNGFLAANGAVGWWDLYDGSGTLAGVVEWVADGAGNGEFGIAITSGANAGSALVYGALDGTHAIWAWDATRSQEAWVKAYADRSGEVRLPDFKGGLPACWDTSFVNATCP